MATLSQNVLTLADWAKRLDPDGKPPLIVEMLSQTNEILDDMMFMEGNLPIGHQTTIRTGLPTVYWRKLNAGVPTSKSTTAQITESCAMLEARSEVDIHLANLNANLGAFRLSESKSYLEAMSQEQAQTLLYGNVNTAPEEYTGLATRYSDLSAENGQNIVNGGGSGSDNTSIWLIVWGSDSCHGIFPKGSMAGLDHQDLGIIDAFDSNGYRFRAYSDLYTWKTGLVVKDWRQIVRICNLDVSNLVSGSGAADIVKKMIDAVHRIHNLQSGRAVFYANRTVLHYLDTQRYDAVKAGGGLTYENVDGKVRMSFRGIPIKIVDSLLNTEATVS